MTPPPRHWLRVLAALWRVNVSEELQYRANFFTSVVGTTFSLATAWLTVSLFFRHASAIGGWEYWEVVVLLGVFTALSGVIETVLRPGIGQLAEQVRSGDLDLVLARPVDAQILVSFRGIDVWRVTDIAVGVIVAGYALVRLDRVPHLLEIVAFAVALVAAGAVVYALWVALMSLAFWFVAVENLWVLFDAVFEGARYPVSAYPGALRLLFVYLIPVAWTTTIPAGALTGRFSPEIALASALAGAAAIVLARLLWRTAIRRYTGAGG